MSAAKKNNFFEDGLSRLEDLVSQLENDDLSLDDSLKNFEEGMELIKKLTAKLNEASHKIELLSQKSSGEPQSEPFEPEKSS